ncbi:MAG: hypothetical protein NZ519_10835, partial [Bacteroidia bacterium]|nr:hypothetical protein [Bacteroidia bacterium]
LKIFYLFVGRVFWGGGLGPGGWVGGGARPPPPPRAGRPPPTLALARGTPKKIKLFFRNSTF